VQAKTNDNIVSLETRKAARAANSRGSPNRLIGILFSHLALASAALIPSLSAAACVNSSTRLARVTGQYIKVLCGHETSKKE